MPFQQNFDRITQTDLDNLDVDKKVVIGPWYGDPVLNSTDNFYIPIDTEAAFEYPAFEVGYVSRVVGGVEGGTIDASPVELDITISPQSGGGGSTVSLTDLNDSDTYYDSGALSSSFASFSATDAVSLEWTTDNSYAETSAPVITLWVEITIPAT